MIVNITPEDGDDQILITCLSSMIARLTADGRPRELYVTRVSKWFDHKWLRFAGRGRVRFDGISPEDDVALDGFWPDHLTFPPFSPKQLSAPVAWQLKKNGAYVRIAKPRPFFKFDRRHSSTNLQHRVRCFSESALFIWFSSLSERNGMASVMAYSVEGSIEEAWYVSFRRGLAWEVGATKGIPRERILQLFPLSRRPHTILQPSGATQA